MSYQDMQLTVPSGDETKQIDVLINYTADRFSGTSQQDSTGAEGLSVFGVQGPVTKPSTP